MFLFYLSASNGRGNLPQTGGVKSLEIAQAFCGARGLEKSATLFAVRLTQLLDHFFQFPTDELVQRT